MDITGIHSLDQTTISSIPRFSFSEIIIRPKSCPFFWQPYYPFRYFYGLNNIKTDMKPSDYRLD
jgi:hypothetical protein